MVEHLGDGRFFLSRRELLGLICRIWLNLGFASVLGAIESPLTNGTMGLPSAPPCSALFVHMLYNGGGASP